MNPEEDHTALALELSQLSEMYNRSISIRQANNQRKAEKEKGGKDGDAENGDNDEPMTTAMRLGSELEDEDSKIEPFALMTNLVEEDEQDDVFVENENDDNEDAVDYE